MKIRTKVTKEGLEIQASFHLFYLFLVGRKERIFAKYNARLRYALGSYSGEESSLVLQK